MKRRAFIPKAILAAMGCAFAIEQTAHALWFAVLVIVVITIIGTIIYQLWKTCKKYLGTPPNPPPDQAPDHVVHGPSLDAGSAGAINMLFDKEHIPVAAFSEIPAQFLTPDGVTYYTGVFMATVYDSVDLAAWEITGTVIAWLSEGFIKIQNCDALGNVMSVVTTPNWNSNVQLPLFSPQCQPSPQRFFKMLAT